MHLLPDEFNVPRPPHRARPYNPSFSTRSHGIQRLSARLFRSLRHPAAADRLRDTDPGVAGGQGEMCRQTFDNYLTLLSQDLESETVEDLGCWDIQDKRWDDESIYLEPPVDLKLGPRCIECFLKSESYARPP